jgi:benzoyl-CoA reductase subunit B
MTEPKFKKSEKTDQEIFKELREEFERYFVKKETQVMEAIQKGEPILGGTAVVIPELMTALDLTSWFAAALMLKATQSEIGPALIDQSYDLLGSNFMCSLQVTGLAMLENNLFPPPTMLMSTNGPCDANAMMGQILLDHPPWKDVPKFIMDTPHQNTLDHMDYLGNQMREFVSFVEKQSGKKLDMDRFKAVCEEANKAFHLMNELQELKRAVPCPVEFDWGWNAFYLARWLGPGMPDVTAWMERVVNVHEKRVKEKKGIDGVDEKIRYVWFDVIPNCSEKLFSRVEKELGAVLVMDMFAYNPPYTVIDTSSEERMFRSFARRIHTDEPMFRQAMATMEMYTGDIKRIVNDFNIDAVILPLHRGHKDIHASAKIIRDMCKELGVPFTTIGCDLFDERVMSVDQIVEKMSLFFESAGLA